MFTEAELSARYYMRTFRYHTDASVERRSYRERAVRACADGYGSVAKMAALLGVNAVTLKRWRTDLAASVATHSTSDSAAQDAEGAPVGERFVVSSASLADLLDSTVQEGEGDDELLRRIVSASVLALLRSGEFAVIRVRSLCERTPHTYSRMHTALVVTCAQLFNICD